MDKFNTVYNQYMFETTQTYQNQTLVCIPGKFNLKSKECILLIEEYTKLNPDQIFIFLSNNTKDNISKRPLSKSNLQPLAKIISEYKNKDIFKSILDKLETLTYKDIVNFISEVKDKSLKHKLEKYKGDLDKTLFKSLTKENGQYVKPEEIKSKLEQDLSQFPNVKIEIGNERSPMIDILNFVNDNCKDCNIYLGSVKNTDENSSWDSLLNKFSKKNNIVPYYFNY